MIVLTSISFSIEAFLFLVLAFAETSTKNGIFGQKKEPTMTSPDFGHRRIGNGPGYRVFLPSFSSQIFGFSALSSTTFDPGDVALGGGRLRK